MPLPDNEPQYWLRDSNGNVVGALYLDADGNPAIVDENENEASLESDGTWNVPAVSTVDAVITQGHGFLGLPNHHVSYESGLSNEEISRFTLTSGDVLQVWRLEAALKGGGSDSNVSVNIYDETNASQLASADAGSLVEGASTPIGTSGAGATITVRLSTGSSSVNLTNTGIVTVVSQ